jgi:hypothetical protein
MPGKQNYLVMIRTTYGREFILFKRESEQGVQINAVGAVGPAIGLVAPYYIEYRFDNRTQRTEPYNPTRHPSFENVIGAPGIFTGIGQSQIAIGGSFKSNVTGFELGVTADFMSKEVMMMPLAENRSNFISAYVVLFYGGRK